jgi:hypothetical protein
VGPYRQFVGVAATTAGLHTATGRDEADRHCGGDGLEKHSGLDLAHGSSWGLGCDGCHMKKRFISVMYRFFNVKALIRFLERVYGRMTT